MKNWERNEREELRMNNWDWRTENEELRMKNDKWRTENDGMTNWLSQTIFFIWGKMLFIDYLGI